MSAPTPGELAARLGPVPEVADLREVSLPSVLLVTGTGTGVGKTVATAALASVLRARGSVCVVKPCQTGVRPGEPGDIETVRALAGEPLTTRELVRLEHPLAPSSAARISGEPLPPVARHALEIARMTEEHDIVLVEGAGGLLVHLDERGGTLADLAAVLRYKGTSVGAVVVADPALGCLSATQLTTEALRAKQIGVLGVVVGRWPATPGLAEEVALRELPAVADAPLISVIPEGAGELTTEDFRSAAPTWHRA